ncbi:MAG: hypothetical protein ACR2FV_05015 [Ornithinimicrobium sp.]
MNFDRLIEQALRAEGIEATVVASPADVAGPPAALLAHLDRTGARRPRAG